MKRRNGRMGRVREEPNVDFGTGLKGRTSNVQRSTSNTQRREGRVREEPEANYGRRLKGRTPNAQRPTPRNSRGMLSNPPKDGFAVANIQRGDQNSTVSNEQRFDLEERLLDYAVRIRLVDALPGSRAGRHVADQLRRCGTSPLANHGELQGAESRKDFIHRLGVCLKEMRESPRWLRLVHRVPLPPPSKIGPILVETEALIKIFSASIRTAEKNKA